MRLLVLAVFASLLLAGCSGPAPDRHFTVAEDAPAEVDGHVGDGYDLRVRVVDQAGQPVAGAAVVYFASSTTTIGEASAEGMASPWGASGGASFEFTISDDNVVAAARTNSAGEAVADLPPGGSIHVAAGGVSGLTTELREAVAVGSGGDGGTIAFTLYPETISHTFEVAMANTVGRAGIGGTPSDAHPIVWSEEFHDEYAARILSFELVGTWENDPMVGAADIYLGAGGPDDVLVEGNDRNQFDFSNEETLSVAASDLHGHRPSLIDAGYHVHLMTDKAAVSWSGLPVTLTVEAQLKGSNVVIR